MVATLLYQFLSCWCLAKSTFLPSISVLQFCLYSGFLADKVSSRSYVSFKHYRWWSFAYFICTLLFWDRRSEQIRYAVFFQHGFAHSVYVQMVWPSTYFFAKNQHDTLSTLPPETAVHGCNHTLSVSVLLVSHKVNVFM